MSDNHSGLYELIERQKKQLLEANAKIGRLKTKLSDAETVGEKSLALHDADVIASLNTKAFLDANVWDGEDRAGCSDDYARFTPDELQELIDDMQELFSEALRNSVKDGE